MIPAMSSINDAREVARRRLPHVIYEFIIGGAEDEQALRANLHAFQRLTLRPRVLVDVSVRDLSVSVFGTRIALPVMIAPTGLARLAGREGDIAGARAAGRNKTIFTLSCMSSHTIEEVAHASSGPLWFQVYLWRHREVVESLVVRAKAAGFQALVVTVDVPINGKRERDLRNGFVVPPRPTLHTAVDILRHPRWVLTLRPPITFKNLAPAASPQQTIAHAKYFNEVLSNPAATWREIDWLRDLWQGPIIVKGILTPEAAEEAVAHGVDGIIVSNHGGRQLDAAPASLDALRDVAEAVHGRVELFLDGGVRRGSDVIKAAALGAKACLIGRPWLYGLASGGEDGVVRILEILREEIDRTFILLGRRSFTDLDRSVVGSSRNGEELAHATPHQR
jgi:L-lactate dehydrogenase (cytochrome)